MELVFLIIKNLLNKKLMESLNNKVALVTGASKGIGAGIAKELALNGVLVVINYNQDATGANAAVKEIENQGGKAIALQGDVSKVEDVEKLFLETKNTFGRFDILVNNAGVFPPNALANFSEVDFHRTINTNVLGNILCTKESLKYFSPDGGCIINLASVQSKNPIPEMAVYASTKGAIEILTMAYAKELASKNIRVNALAPGAVETEGTHTRGWFKSDFHKNIEKATPMGRMGQPADIGKIAVFLASEDSFWITGERIVASGGLH
jgi:3-oxoacyl-[acyl-carrier protein] reductase